MKQIIFYIFILASLQGFTQPSINKPPAESPFSKQEDNIQIKGGSIYSFEATMLNRGILAVSYKHKFGFSQFTMKLGIGLSTTKDFYLAKRGFDASLFDDSEVLAQIETGTSKMQMYTFGFGYIFGKSKTLNGFSINHETKIGTARIHPSLLTHTTEISSHSKPMYKKTVQYSFTLNYSWAPDNFDRIIAINGGCGLGIMVDSLNDSYLQAFRSNPTKYLYISENQVRTTRIAPIFTLSIGIGSKPTRQ